jgi:hypothetical protein
MVECEDFIAQLLPTLDTLIAGTNADAPAAEAPSPQAESPAARSDDPAKPTGVAEPAAAG